MSNKLKKTVPEESSIKQFSNWSGSYERGLLGKYFRYSAATSVTAALLYKRKAERILDIGAGTGLLFEHLQSTYMPKRIVALDISESMLSIAKKKRMAKPTLLTAIISSATSIPFDSNYFDIAFCINAFHHFPDHEKVLVEIARVLRNGGIFVLLDLSLDGQLRKVWAKINKQAFKEPYAKYHTTSELKLHLKNAGLKIVHTQNLMYFAKIHVIKK
jgi:ubiquinone/menaquinone biosynthesis C-methylase UbiE